MTLAASHLTVRLGGVNVVSDVTATFEPGTITAICGPNGAGKSTMLTTLAGLLYPASGEVTIDGKALGMLSPRDRAKLVGYLPQLGEVAWDLSVANLVALGRLPHRDRGEEAVAEALAAMDLAELAERPVSSLSGGERARALLARVLAGEPRWILADEPFAALDLGHQIALLARLRAIADAGVGVVIVVHDLGLAMNGADRVLVFDYGRLAADGAPEQALRKEVIANVWKVCARWLGNPGGRALLAG